MIVVVGLGRGAEAATATKVRSDSHFFSLLSLVALQPHIMMCTTLAKYFQISNNRTVSKVQNESIHLQKCSYFQMCVRPIAEIMSIFEDG